MSNDKADGLARIERMETNYQKKANSGPAHTIKNGPANGGSLSGSPTKDGKIKRG